MNNINKYRQIRGAPSSKREQGEGKAQERQCRKQEKIEKKIQIRQDIA